MFDFKKRVMSVLLCAALLISACTKKETSEETSSSATKEQVTSVEETMETSQDATTPDPSSGNSSSGYMPPDSMVKEFVKRAKDNATYSQDMTLVLCANGKYKMVNTMSLMQEIYLLMMEYEFSEDCLNQKKERQNRYANMTLDEYRETLADDISQQEIDKYFDKDYHLKKRLETRVMVTVYSELGDTFDDDAFLEECIRAGFDLIEKEPELKESIDDALYGECVRSNTAQYLGILLGLDTEQNVLVQVEVMTYDNSTLHAETTIQSNFDKLENKMQGTADIRISNVFNGRYTSQSFEMEWTEEETPALFEQLEALRKDSSLLSNDEVEGLNQMRSVGIHFQDTYKSRYSYIRDGIWKYESITLRSEVFFRPNDQDASERLLDELRMQASLSVITQVKNISGTMTADYSKIYDAPALSDQYPEGNYQAVVFYVNPDSYWLYMHSEEGDGVFYFEEMHGNQVGGGGQTYVTSHDEYEYAGVPGEMYYRPDMTDVFYKAEEFTGHGSLSYLLKEKEEAYQFLYGIDVKNGTDTYRCDVYENEKYRLAVLLNEQGVPFGGWRWSEDEEKWDDKSNGQDLTSGLGVIQDILTQEWDPQIEEYLEHARAHLSTDGPSDQNGNGGQGKPGVSDGNNSGSTPAKSAADWVREDQTERNLPDLTAKIEKGDTLDQSPVVKEYLDYLATGGPTTVELWKFGAFKNYHEVVTIKDMDFYHSQIVASHDNSSDFDFLYVALGDYVYQGSIESPKRFEKDEYFTEREVQLQLPDPLTAAKEHAFKRAYEATIDNQPYIVEEWTVDGKDVIYYCQDDKIVGFRYIENGYAMLYHIVSFDKTADETLLQVPGN